VTQGDTWRRRTASRGLGLSSGGLALLASLSRWLRCATGRKPGSTSSLGINKDAVVLWHCRTAGVDGTLGWVSVEGTTPTH
jgi:hypothetical protein